MAILRVNAKRDGTLVLPNGQDGWRETLSGALDAAPQGARLCVLIHGYRFTHRLFRGRPAYCPQARLYRNEQVRPTKLTRPPLANWPHMLGFEAEGREDGLCICFGWDGRRDPLAALAAFGRNDFAIVYEAARSAGAALARLLALIAERRPDIEIDFLTHSLGARVALEAFAARPDLRMGRAVMLGAAEYAGRSAAVMDMQDRAGGTVEVYHAMSRANDLFDALFEVLSPRPEQRGDRPLGVRGLDAARHAGRWIDIQLDHPETVALLTRRGHRLERADERISHWHFYADAGAMAAWRSVLRERENWRIPVLRRQGMDALDPRRWSRLSPALPSFAAARPADGPAQGSALTGI